MSTNTAAPAKTKTPRKSPEERKAQAEALHASIADQIDALRDSDEWRRYLDRVRDFHQYSIGNLLLIMQQCPHARAVAGFRQWQARGRQVRKGEKAIRIFGYSAKKITEENEQGEETERRIPRFPVLSVFDVSQTDAIDGVEDAEIVRDLTGTTDHGVIDALTAFLAAEGWTVGRERLDGEKKGFARPSDRAVIVEADVSDEQAAKTLIHETAHVILGHTDDLPGYAEHRGIYETEAESVAYVVAGLVGFDTSAYSIGYIAGWADGDAELVKSTAARVLAAAHRIAAALDAQDDAETDDEAA
jgi:antirestriction protein ArdC